MELGFSVISVETRFIVFLCKLIHNQSDCTNLVAVRIFRT